MVVNIDFAEQQNYRCNYGRQDTVWPIQCDVSLEGTISSASECDVDPLETGSNLFTTRTPLAVAALILDKEGG